MIFEIFWMTSSLVGWVVIFSLVWLVSVTAIDIWLKILDRKKDTSDHSVH